MTTPIASATLFYTHGFITMLFIGVVFTPVGILVGRLAWRHLQHDAEEVGRANVKLEAEHLNARNEIEVLEGQLEELEAAHA